MWLLLPRANLIDNESYFMSHGREIAVFEIKIGLRHSQIGLNAFQLYVRRPGLSTGPRFISFCITSRLRSRHVTDIQCQYAFYFRFINREYPHSQNIHIWKTTFQKYPQFWKYTHFKNDIWKNLTYIYADLKMHDQLIGRWLIFLSTQRDVDFRC